MSSNSTAASCKRMYIAKTLDKRSTKHGMLWVWAVSCSVHFVTQQRYLSQTINIFPNTRPPNPPPRLPSCQIRSCQTSRASKSKTRRRIPCLRGRPPPLALSCKPPSLTPLLLCTFLRVNKRTSSANPSTTTMITTTRSASKPLATQTKSFAGMSVRPPPTLPLQT
jgi:hypothetical protein